MTEKTDKDSGGASETGVAASLDLYDLKLICEGNLPIVRKLLTILEFVGMPISEISRYANMNEETVQGLLDTNP